jgi:putative toxin-antitoxin system antitoxin component (TIGR02293 family)
MKQAASQIVDTLLGASEYEPMVLREETAVVPFLPERLVRLVQRGLAMCELESLRQALGLPIEQVASMVGMSKATFHRRQREGKLTTDESDKVVRVARLLGHANAVFGSKEAGREWLTHPQHGLGGAMPLKYAETEVGAREVENLLGRIEYGVYS